MCRTFVTAIFIAVFCIGGIISNSPAWGIELRRNLYNEDNRILPSPVTESKDVTCSRKNCNAIFFQVCLPNNKFCGSGDDVFSGLERPDVMPYTAYKTSVAAANVALNMQLSGGYGGHKYSDKTCAISFTISPIDVANVFNGNNRYSCD